MLESEWFTRLLLALVLAAAGVGAYALINRLLIWRIRRQLGREGQVAERQAAQKQVAQKQAPQAETGEPQVTFLPGHTPGIPAILYFTTPQCVPCKTIQRPALQQIKERLGDRLEVIEVNAQERPDLASRWGVLSVPTTFILDARGSLKHINHGVTRAEALLKQVQGL